MSWNKNTTRSIKIDDITEVLEDLRKLYYIPYKVEILGTVQARGQNDHYDDIEEYELRKLTYYNFVVMEQMLRDSDCDVDDVIIATKFNKDNVPENWELEIEEGELSQH